MVESCPVCQDTLARKALMDERHVFFIGCGRCGTFYVTLEAQEDLAARPFPDVQKGTVSGWLRETPEALIGTADLPRLHGMPRFR